MDPSGSDCNSGTTPDEPLQTINYALKKVRSDSIHPNTIFLANGSYSSSNTNDFFPIMCKSFVSIIGEDQYQTILDGRDYYPHANFY